MLGHALAMKAIHGGKAKNDRIDAGKIAGLLRGGFFPLAYVYPKAKRETRDLLRRRSFFVRQRAQLIAHVQLADNPGRHEPGTGEINYPFVFKALDAGGYDGWIGCEYKPKTETQRGLGWLNETSAAYKQADIIRMRS